MLAQTSGTPREIAPHIVMMTNRPLEFLKCTRFPDAKAVSLPLQSSRGGPPILLVSYSPNTPPTKTRVTCDTRATFMESETTYSGFYAVSNKTMQEASSRGESRLSILTNITQVDQMLFGIMFWECMCTPWFDFQASRHSPNLRVPTTLTLCKSAQFLQNRRSIRYPVVIYWLTKYSTVAFVTVKSLTSYGTKISCQGAGDVANLVANIGKLAPLSFGP